VFDTDPQKVLAGVARWVRVEGGRCWPGVGNTGFKGSVHGVREASAKMKAPCRKASVTPRHESAVTPNPAKTRSFCDILGRARLLAPRR
jgi:hypothetical protein